MKSPDGYRTMYGVAESNDGKLSITTIEARPLLDNSGYQTRTRRGNSVYLDFAKRLFDTPEDAEERLAELLLERNSNP